MYCNIGKSYSKKCVLFSWVKSSVCISLVSISCWIENICAHQSESKGLSLPLKFLSKFLSGTSRENKYEITRCFFASHDTFFWPCSSFLTFCGLVWPCLTSSDSLDLPWPYLTSSDLIWPPLTHLTSPDLDWPLLTFPDPLTSCDLINPGLAWPIAGSGLILFDLAWPHIWPCLTSPGFSFRHPNIF